MEFLQNFWKGSLKPLGVYTAIDHEASGNLKMVDGLKAWDFYWSEKPVYREKNPRVERGFRDMPMSQVIEIAFQLLLAGARLRKKGEQMENDVTGYSTGGCLNTERAGPNRGTHRDLARGKRCQTSP